MEHSRFIYQLHALIDIPDSSEHSKLRNQVCLLRAAGFEMKSPVYKASGVRFLALCGLHLYRSSQSLTNGQCLKKIKINVFILLGSVLQSYERKKGTFMLCNPNHYLLSFLMVSYTSLCLWFVVNINEWKCNCVFLSLQCPHIDRFALDFDKFLMVVRMSILWIFTVFLNFLSVKIIRRVWTIDFYLSEDQAKCHLVYEALHSVYTRGRVSSISSLLPQSGPKLKRFIAGISLLKHCLDLK